MHFFSCRLQGSPGYSEGRSHTRNRHRQGPAADRGLGARKKAAEVNMRFVVVGAGAIGAYAGALLHRAGEDVTLIARGPHLRAMQEHGVRLRLANEELQARARVTDDESAAGIADVILLTLKAHSLTEMAPRLAPIVGPDTSVVTMQNGIPWWYFYRHGGVWEGTHLESVDPGGTIEKYIDSSRIVGSVVYVATIISEPGV